MCPRVVMRTETCANLKNCHFLWIAYPLLILCSSLAVWHDFLGSGQGDNNLKKSHKWTRRKQRFMTHSCQYAAGVRSTTWGHAFQYSFAHVNKKYYLCIVFHKNTMYLWIFSIHISMEGINNQILASVKKCGRGYVFFADRFAKYGSATNIRKALSLLVQDGIIIRVARGIYCYPKIDTYSLSNTNNH